MNKAPRITIVTPTKNRLALLSEAIASVRGQTFTDWEHVIVDDGSDDGTAEAVEALATADPRIRFVRRAEGPAGASVCRNIGVRAAAGEFVIFLDSDDLLEPQCLAGRVPVLARNADADFVTFQTGYFIDVIGDQTHERDPQLLGDDLTRFLYFETPWIITGPIWRREALLRLGLFDEALPSWQDIELHVRALTSGLRYLRFPEVDHHVRWQNSVGRISAEQRRSPRHLDAAVVTLEKFERMVREGPGMTWVRRQALCSLYFFLAECWVGRGDLPAARRTWRLIRERGLGSPLLHLSGALLLTLLAWRLPVGRVIHKWKGWMRLRTNPEVVA